MELLFTMSIFIMLVILGSFLNNKIPRIPAALFQIILGFIIAFLPITLHFEFESEAFMGLVIAPLLFVDAFKASRSKLWMYKKPILYMAMGLVIVTVVIVGSFINLIIPAISFWAALSLAAILSPTDAVAVKSITKGMKLPKGLMSILEGESLLNDAAGLVSFQIALAAIITQTFSLGKASENFLVAALGGAVLGLILGIIFTKIKMILRYVLTNEVSVLVIFQIMIPIIIYFIAEHIHVSGIIAVVITGIVLNFEKDLYQREAIGSEAAISILSNQDTISYILNGFVFVFLGYLLPDIFKNMLVYKDLSIHLALLYVVLIAVALMLVRFLFVYIFYLQFQPHSFSSPKKVIKFFKERKLDVGNYSRFEYSFIASLCGIHGTVTLATALMIPLTLPSGESFPLRDVILFIGSGVVLLSMILGTIFLPLTIKSTEEEDHMEQRAIKEYILAETIKEVEQNFDRENSTDKQQIAFAMLIKKLREQQVYYSSDERFLVKEVQKIYKEIAKKEKMAIQRIVENNNNDRLVNHVLNLMQLRIKILMNYSISQQMYLQLKLSMKTNFIKRLAVTAGLLIDSSWRRNGRVTRINSDERNKLLADRIQNARNIFEHVSEELYEAARETAENMRTERNDLAIDFVLSIYKNFNLTQYNIYVTAESFSEELRIIQMEAIQLQKYRIMTMKKLSHIDDHDADIILRDLNYNEALLFAGEE